MGFMDSIREQAGMEVKRHPVDQFFFELCPKLTLQQRLMGYAACLFVGFVLNVGSWARLVDLFRGNPDPFVIFFTIGNFISVMGSFFLNGPYAQSKKMIGPQMRCATIAFAIAMAMTFFVCYYDGIHDGSERVGLVILLIVIQYICMIWWIICSVWFLKAMVLNCLRGTFQKNCPSCAKGCKCVCDALDDAKETASPSGKNDRKSASKSKSKDTKSSGNSKSFLPLFSSEKEPEPEPKKGFFANLV